MNITELFSSYERVKIMENIIYKTEPFTVNKTAKELKLSKGLLSKFLRILVKNNILKKQRNNFKVEDNLNVKKVKIFLNLDSLDFDFNKYPFIKGVGLYGSYAKGTNTEASDIDVWMSLNNASEKDLSNLKNKLRDKYNNINILFLDKNKLEKLK